MERWESRWEKINWRFLIDDIMSCWNLFATHGNLNFNSLYFSYLQLCFHESSSNSAVSFQFEQWVKWCLMCRKSSGISLGLGFQSFFFLRVDVCHAHLWQPTSSESKVRAFDTVLFHTQYIATKSKTATPTNSKFSTMCSYICYIATRAQHVKNPTSTPT